MFPKLLPIKRYLFFSLLLLLMCVEVFWWNEKKSVSWGVFTLAKLYCFPLNKKLASKTVHFLVLKLVFFIHKFSKSISSLSPSPVDCKLLLSLSKIVTLISKSHRYVFMQESEIMNLSSRSTFIYCWCESLMLIK